MSLSCTIHEMISEQAPSSYREHSGYNLLDETAARYGHCFTRLGVRVSREAVEGGMMDSDAAVVLVIPGAFRAWGKRIAGCPVGSSFSMLSCDGWCSIRAFPHSSRSSAPSVTSP